MDTNIQVYNEVNKFIKFINSLYPIEINCLLDGLTDKYIYKNHYYTITVLIDIKGYQQKNYFDVLFDEFIDFNTIYQQIHILIGEMMQQIGI